MTNILIVEDSDVDFEVLQRSLLKTIPHATISHDVYGVEALEKLNVSGEPILYNPLSN